MSLLDIDDDTIIARADQFFAEIKFNENYGEFAFNLTSNLLEKIKKGSTGLMPRICLEVNSEYTFKVILTDGKEVNIKRKSEFRGFLSSVLSSNGEEKLVKGVTYIDCQKVDRMGTAVDFVITALHRKSPIVLIENITELPDSPRRKDIEDVLIHSWAKNKFVFLDNVYDNSSTIVIFTAHPRNEIKTGYYPVWDEYDHYQWYGNILKDYFVNGSIFIEELNEQINRSI